MRVSQATGDFSPEPQEARASAYGIQYSGCTGLYPGSGGLCHAAQACGGLHHPGVCERVPCDAHTTKSPNDTFLRRSLAWPRLCSLGQPSHKAVQSGILVTLRPALMSCRFEPSTLS